MLNTLLPLLLVAPALQPSVVETRFPTADLVVASQVLMPDRPEEDATPRIQSAINTVAEAGGGVVFLQPGWYRLAGRLALKEGVTLRGDYDPSQPGEAPRATVLMPTADRGDESAPAAITLEPGTGLRELVIWYPDQRPADPAPYPWTIRTSQERTGDNTTILNVAIVNPWQGIKIGPESNELHTIRNVRMTPLKCGLSLDSTTDIGRLMDVDLSHEAWSQSGFANAPHEPAEQRAVNDLLRQQAIGIDMGRSDWEYIYRVRASGLNVGLQCRAGERGTANAVMLDCQLTDCETALRLDRLNSIGLSVSYCTLAGTQHAVEAIENFTTVAQFNRCDLRAERGSAVTLAGNGTLTFQSCRIAGRTPAVAASQGNLSVVDCLLDSTRPQVELADGVRRARIFSQAAKPGLNVVDQSAGDVLIAETGADLPDLTAPRISAPERHPAVRKLVVATDHGVSVESADNTAALQSALDAASGGGTVYLPAGLYRCAGSVRVPAGVELRGSFDVPHHTMSGGSVLMPTGGAGQEDGQPFIELAAGSGARGLCVWYPEQNLAAPVPYPWAIRSLGPDCWLTDVNLGNAWQGVDFWTHPSDRHVIRYLSGCCLRRGLFVSKSDGPGWIENLQFNPHYALRLHRSLPRPKYEGDIGGKLIHDLRDRLEGVVVGRCQDEQLLGTFLYAAEDGLAFKDDGGGAKALVLQHGSDTVGRSLVLEAADEVYGVHLQVVPLSHKAVGAFVTGPSFAGHARFVNSQVWAGQRTALLQGPGTVELEQLNTLTGPIEVEGGTLALTNALFSRLQPHPVRLGAKATATVRVGIMNGPFEVAAAPGAKLTQFGNTASIPPQDPAGAAAAYQLATGWETGQPQGAANQVATRGGGLKTVSGHSCQPVDGVGRDGGRALKLTGTVDDPSYSYVYFRIFDGPVKLAEDSRLTYWLKPLNDRAKATFVDLLFADGKVLRDAGGATVEGAPARGAGGLCTVGEWRQIEVPLGKFAGNDVVSVMFAYDSRSGGGTFECLLDDLSIGSELAGKPWQVALKATGQTLTFAAGEGARVRYTLDGSNPTLHSPLADGAVELPPGADLLEIRYRAEHDGWLSPVIYAAMWSR